MTTTKKTQCQRLLAYLKRRKKGITTTGSTVTRYKLQR